MWLFALKNLNVENVYFHDIDSFSALLNKIELVNVDTSMFNALINDIGRREFSFSSCLELLDVLYLGSGTLQFLNDQHHQL